MNDTRLSTLPKLIAHALKCPGCGAGLKIGESVDSFACAYCGAGVCVERGEGVVSLRLLTDAPSNVQCGTDRTAAESTIRRLSDEIVALQGKKDALLVSRQAASVAWDQVMTGPITIMAVPTIAATSVWVLVIALSWSMTWLNGMVKVAVAFGAAIAVAVYAVRSMDRVLAEQKAMRDQDLGAYSAREKDLQLRIDAAASKLMEQRQIVDS